MNIDRTLISAIHLDGFSQAIVASLAAIADGFGIPLVAGGLEVYGELDCLEVHYPQILLRAM